MGWSVPFPSVIAMRQKNQGAELGILYFLELLSNNLTGRRWSFLVTSPKGRLWPVRAGHMASLRAGQGLRYQSSGLFSATGGDVRVGARAVQCLLHGG